MRLRRAGGVSPRFVSWKQRDEIADVSESNEYHRVNTAKRNSQRTVVDLTSRCPLGRSGYGFSRAKPRTRRRDFDRAKRAVLIVRKSLASRDLHGIGLAPGGLFRLARIEQI